MDRIVSHRRCNELLASLPGKGFQILVGQPQNFLCHAISLAYNEYAGQP